MGSLAGTSLGNLVAHLGKKFRIKDFIETGTFMGNGSAWAAQHFPSVTTIEINDEFRQKAMQSHGHLGTINFLLGDSIAALPGVVAKLDGPAFFWLDAHAGGGHFAKEDYCPVVQELEIIAASSPHEHFIFVDDARGFTAPPPPPFQVDKWPPLFDVLTAARKRHPYYCVVIHDTIMCVPPHAKPDIIDFCNQIRPKI